MKFKLQYIPLVAIVGFAVLLVLLYIIEKPIDRPASIVQFPYVISAKPGLIKIGESSTITVSILNGASPNLQKDALFVITPDGTKLIPRGEITDLSRLRFPQDFIPARAGQLGSHAL